MDEELRKHRAMDTLLAISKLGTVGTAQCRGIQGLVVFASGIGTDLDVLGWKSYPGNTRLEVELSGLGVQRVTKPSPGAG